MIAKEKSFKDLTDKKLQFAFDKEFSDIKGKVNLIFVDKKFIKELNKQFRDKNEPTDVLSFEAAGNGVAEVYVSPEIVSERVKSENDLDEELFKDELLRICVHGILHISGHSHMGYYTGPYKAGTDQSNYDKMHKVDEPMFIEQEKRLSRLIQLIN